MDPVVRKEEAQTLRRPGPPTFPPSRSPLLCSELCPRGSANRKAIPRQPREQTVSFLSPRLGVERIDRLLAFPRWHGDQRDEGQERRHEQRNKHPCEPGTALRKGDKGHQGHAGQ